MARAQSHVTKDQQAAALPVSLTVHAHPHEGPGSTGSRAEWYNTHCHNYMHDLYKPPLRIYYAGQQIWGAGGYWKRKHSRVFNIGFVTKGDILLEQNGEKTVIGANQVIIEGLARANALQPGPSGLSHKRFVMIDGPALIPLLQQTGLESCNRIIPRNPEDINRLIKSAIKELREKRLGFTKRLATIAFDIINELAANIASSDKPNEVERAIEYMQSNVHRALSVQEIAEHVCMSVSSFHDLFKHYMSDSPIHFFIMSKMNLARQLLVSTDFPIKRIAYQLGFNDPLYFSAQFKSHIGLSPKRYRELSKNDPRVALEK